MFFVFCFKQKTAYEVRISDWSSDVCSSDLDHDVARIQRRRELGFDVDSKDLFGHRPVDDPGSSQAIAESLAQRILRPPAIAAKAVGFGLTQTVEANQTIASAQQLADASVRCRHQMQLVSLLAQRNASFLYRQSAV